MFLKLEKKAHFHEYITRKGTKPINEKTEKFFLKSPPVSYFWKISCRGYAGFFEQTIRLLDNVCTRSSDTDLIGKSQARGPGRGSLHVESSCQNARGTQ